MYDTDQQDELIFDEPLTALELAECEARLEAARASWDDLVIPNAVIIPGSVEK